MRHTIRTIKLSKVLVNGIYASFNDEESTRYDTLT